MMIERQAAFLILKKWKQNPAATKRQVGTWQHWTEEPEGNNRPLTGVEVEGMKAFLKRNAPTQLLRDICERGFFANNPYEITSTPGIH